MSWNAIEAIVGLAAGLAVGSVALVGFALAAGLALNALWGWWWADPVAALGVAALAAREGVELWRTEDVCCP